MKKTAQNTTGSNNHEQWHTCANCGKVYDLRQQVTCPVCGQHFQTNTLIAQ